MADTEMSANWSGTIQLSRLFAQNKNIKQKQKQKQEQTKYRQKLNKLHQSTSLLQLSNENGTLSV